MTTFDRYSSVFISQTYDFSWLLADLSSNFTFFGCLRTKNQSFYQFFLRFAQYQYHLLSNVHKNPRNQAQTTPSPAFPDPLRAFYAVFFATSFVP